MKELILCIDLGSSSFRCSLYERKEDNTVHVLEPTSSSEPWEAVDAQTGRIKWWQHGERSLLDIIDQCVNDTLDKLASVSTPTKIVAVGFSCLVMNLIGVDAQGNFVSEEATLSYACNLPQVATKVKQLQRQLGAEVLQELYQKTGTPMHTAYALPQMCVFYENYPQLANKVASWQTLASLCLDRWMQRAEDEQKPWPISFSEASWTGLLNTQTCDYEPAMLNLLPQACRTALPPLADFDQAPAATLRSLYAPAWTALRGARFYLGLGDGACANVGSKCTTSARVACTIGTSAAARVVVEDDGSTMVVPQGLFCYRIHSKYLLLGGALTDGGSVVAWIRELLNLESDEEMQACLLQVEAQLEQDYKAVASQQQRRPLLLLPFLSGERSTNFQTGATGALVGITRATTRAHMVQACLEGVTLRLAAIARCLPPNAQIWVSGKALEVNTVWRQMIADCTGRTVVLDLDTAEGSSRGVACLVAASWSGQALIAEAASTNAEETQPRPEGKVYWEMLVRAQERFVDAMRPIYADS